MKDINLYIVEKFKISKDIKVNKETDFTKKDKYYCEVTLVEFTSSQSLEINIHDIDNDFLNKIEKLEINKNGFYEETYYGDMSKFITIFLKLDDCLDLLNDVCLNLQKNKKELKDKYFNNKIRISNISYSGDPHEHIKFIKYIKKEYNL